MLAVSSRTDRTKFRKQVLGPLLEAGFVQMTSPEAPRSSKQRYRITPLGRETLDGGHDDRARATAYRPPERSEAPMPRLADLTPGAQVPLSKPGMTVISMCCQNKVHRGDRYIDPLDGGMVA